jgi:hypothetical protein
VSGVAKRCEVHYVRNAVAELFSDACVLVRLDTASGVVHFVRTEQAYPSHSEIVALHARVGRILDRIGRERHTLLVDMRRAPMNNDPAFEKAAESARRILLRGFPRVAVLVQTAVGALQVKRHVREDGREIGVFTSEQDARAFLAGQLEVEEAPKSGVESSRGGPFQSLTRGTSRR